MNQSVLDNPENAGLEGPSGSGGGIFKWLVVIGVIILIGGGGYWYYDNYIVGNRGHVQPSPSVEITEAIWKTKSEKTVKDFMDFWQKSSNTTDGLVQANKARDLLTIAAQAKVETMRDSQGNPVNDLATRLNYFIGNAEKATGYTIVSSRMVDDSTVEVKVNLKYQAPKEKVFIVKSENNIWLIDSVKDYATMVSPSPTSSPVPTASLSQSPKSQ